MPCGRLGLSQVKGKPSGGERWEGAILEQGRTDALATDAPCLKNEEGK